MFRECNDISFRGLAEVMKRCCRNSVFFSTEQYIAKKYCVGMIYAVHHSTVDRDTHTHYIHYIIVYITYTHSSSIMLCSNSRAAIRLPQSTSCKCMQSPVCQ